MRFTKTMATLSVFKASFFIFLPDFPPLNQQNIFTAKHVDKKIFFPHIHKIQIDYFCFEHIFFSNRIPSGISQQIQKAIT